MTAVQNSTNRVMKKAIIAICTLLVLASCGKSHDKFVQKHRTPGSDPVTVRVIPVSDSETAGMSSYVGTVESSRTSVITCPAAGTVTQVYVSEGRKVKAGEKLARIESQTLVSAYEMAKATLEQAKDGMERLEKVYESGSVPEIKMVEMRTNLQKAIASENAAARALEDCILKAPFSGVVEGLDVSAGEDAEFARVLMRIIDPSSVEIHFPLPESEYRNVAVGDTAMVTVPAIEASFNSKILTKGSVASALSHSYDCTLACPTSASGIMPGMVCKVYLKHEGGSGTVIPSNSVMTDGNGRYVWIVHDGVVGKSYIKVGGYSGNGIIASEGLQEGDFVIIEGARKVSTGMSVKIVE